jgi:hypothetical protein
MVPAEKLTPPNRGPQRPFASPLSILGISRLEIMKLGSDQEWLSIRCFDKMEWFLRPKNGR